MKRKITYLFAIALVAAISACSALPEKSNSSAEADDSSVLPISITSAPETSSSSSSSKSTNSGSSSDYVDNQLSNESGLTINFSKTGASISSINWGNKQLAKDGFVVGRVANRIAKGKFTLNGQQYSITMNNGDTDALHGGKGEGWGNTWRGPFATRDWTKKSQTATTISYEIESSDGDNGFPGKMNMTVTYTLSQSNELLIEYSATTTKDTLCNPTNHLFIDINGSRSYNDVKLWIDADNYTPLNSSKLPTGQIVSVAGTQFDYRTEKTFDSSKNYDDNLVLNATEYAKVASLKGTQYKVDVFTDRPGLQLYKDGNGNICLETQMMPDAINQTNFEDPILRAGETFYSKTAYCFSKLS